MYSNALKPKKCFIRSAFKLIIKVKDGISSIRWNSPRTVGGILLEVFFKIVETVCPVSYLANTVSTILGVTSRRIPPTGIVLLYVLLVGYIVPDIFPPVVTRTPYTIL